MDLLHPLECLLVTHSTDNRYVVPLMTLLHNRSSRAEVIGFDDETSGELQVAVQGSEQSRVLMLVSTDRSWDNQIYAAFERCLVLTESGTHSGPEYVGSINIVILIDNIIAGDHRTCWIAILTVLEVLDYVSTRLGSSANAENDWGYLACATTSGSDSWLSPPSGFCTATALLHKAASQLPNTSLNCMLRFSRLWRFTLHQPNRCQSPSKLPLNLSLQHKHLPAFSRFAHQLSSTNTTAQMTGDMLNGTSSYGNFDLVKKFKVETGGIVVSKYKSRVTGLSVVHLDYDGEWILSHDLLTLMNELLY